jgi:cyclase
MLRTRVIPALLVRNGSLVKTTRFGSFIYVGDPCNTVKIFNELEVDELFVLDISNDRAVRGPDVKLIKDLNDECFMPLGYGGGVRSLEDAQKVFATGIEKVVVNTAATENASLIGKIASIYGNQAVIVSIDVKRNIFGNYKVYVNSGKKKTTLDTVQWARNVVDMGAGEILLTSINQEGTWQGFDYEIIEKITEAVSVPVIAQGGAGSVEDILNLKEKTNVSAVAIGNLFVFQKKGMGVLVNFPEALKQI